MAKKIVGLLFILAGFATLLLIIFYYNDFKGLWPAIKTPEVDIVDLIEKGQKENIIGENSTDFPLKLPNGFSISIYAKNLGGPRVLSYDPAGNMIVSIPSEGRVVALKDIDEDGFAETHINIAENLNRPHGLATRCEYKNDAPVKPCKIYIAESDGVAMYDYDEQNLKAINKKKIIDLPNGSVHYTRTIMFMPYPDHDKMLISVGSSCNVCEEKDWRRAKILVANYDGSDLKEFARGLRNAVFMAIHPVNGKIWATEMGRDLLGDDLPPDEINVVESGKKYGWPICYGKNIHDNVYDKNTYIRNPCMEPFEKSSHIDIPAHSAPLGLAFFPEDPPSHKASDGQGGWPEDYWHNLLVAYHGSWNRSEPTGYKLVRYRLDENGAYFGQEDFVTGWLAGSTSSPRGENGEVLGRPVDILIQPGGVIYVSDDKAGVIYKIARQIVDTD